MAYYGGSSNTGIDSPQPSFRYSPLDSSKNEIRVLQLLETGPLEPETGADIIECKLSTVSLDDMDGFAYAAVSYVWGSPEPAETIILNGFPVMVATNLYSFLVHAQCDPGLSLWIDALCINQEDTAEKSIQVQKLKTIFDHAATVLAWLGPCKDPLCQTSGHQDGHPGLQWLGAFGDKVRTLPPEANTSALKVRLKEQVAKGDIPWEPILEVWESPIWSRAWCIQELARYNVNIFKGPHLERTTELWANLHAAYGFLYDEGNLAAALISHPSRHDRKMVLLADPFFPVFAATNMKSSDGSPRVTLLSWLWISRRYLYASDPRDRVFALLSLARDVGDLDMVPDYSASCEQVYTDVARAFYHRDATILYHAIAGPQQRTLRSFVPDWTTKLPERTILGSHGRRFGGNFHAGGRSIPQAIVNSAGTQLHVSGIAVDSVEFSADVEPAPEGVGGVVEIRKHLMWGSLCVRRLAMVEKVYTTYFHVHRAKKAIYQTALQVETALLHAITAAVYEHGTAGADSPTEDTARIEEINDLLSSYRFWKAPSEELLYSRGDDDSLENANVKFFLSLAIVGGRRPFITSKGYIGLGPGSMQDEDVVAILVGFEVPVVLRRVVGGFTIIGEAYVYGMMQGEVFEGAVTPDIQTFTIY